MLQIIKKINPSRPVVPLPYPVYFWTAAILVGLGFADAVYLSISHYRVYTDLGYASFCAISKAINCDTVSQSPYSILLGVPVPVWGVFGYAFVLAFLPLAAGKGKNERERLWAFLFGIFLAFSIYSLALGMISALYIHSYCLMCIVSYAINFILLFFAWLIHKRYSPNGIISDWIYDIRYLWQQKRGKIIGLLLAFGITSGVMVTLFPAYWHLLPPPLSESIPTGVTEEGYPWIGAEKPVMTITEFTDYECFQCRKMHFFLRWLIDAHPNKIRLIHRHYPMDNAVNPIVKDPFHVGSAAMSLIAIYAQSKGNFWVMNDILYNIDLSKEVINSKTLMKQAGIDTGGKVPNIYAPEIQIKLLADIKDGIKLGITGTPAYVIDGKVYLGQIPPEIFDKALKPE